MKRLQIFKPGTYVASDGRRYTFTEAQLAATAAAYDPAKGEAPLVVGHPESSKPAYGWVKSLSFADQSLEAEPQQVEPAFEALLKAGRFKKRSASFYAPDAEDNPVKGVYYLRHIGFLGAQPPAVKGLREASFTGSAKSVIEFADMADTANASLWRRLREFIIEKFGSDVADKVIPDYHVSTLEDDARNDPDNETGSLTQMPVTAYSEGAATMKPEEIAAANAQLKKDQDKLASERAEFAEREKALKAEEAARRRAGIVAFIEDLVKQGKLLPVERAPIVELMAAQAPGLTIEFGEGDNKIKQPADEWLKKFLGALPKRVEFGERGAGDGSENAELDASALAQKAVEFVETERQAGRTVNTAQAVEHVKKTLTRS